MRLVESIEKLGAELHLQPLHQPEVFEQTEIPILQPRPVEDTSAGIAKSGGSGCKQRNQSIVGEAFGIKPMLDRPLAGRKGAVMRLAGCQSVLCYSLLWKRALACETCIPEWTVFLVQGDAALELSSKSEVALFVGQFNSLLRRFNRLRKLLIFCIRSG